MRFDHIGIIVADLPAGRQVLRDAFDISCWTMAFSDTVNDVHVQFGRGDSGVCYELIAPMSDASPVRRAVRTGNNITNHVAYRVGNLAEQRSRLVAVDFSPVSDAKPAIAYGGALIQFFMSPIFTLVELIEALDHEHDFQREP